MSDILYNGVSIRDAVMPSFEVGKVHEIGFQLYNDWVNKLDIELDLPVYYDVIYTKRITVYSIREKILILTTVKNNIIKKKLDIFIESVPNISLKPDFRLEKIKKLSKLRNMINNMEVCVQ